METVSLLQGYEMLHQYLEIYRALGTDTDDVMRLLKNMHFENGKPLDPALWDLGLSCVEEVLQSKEKEK